MSAGQNAAPNEMYMSRYVSSDDSEPEENSVYQYTKEKFADVIFVIDGERLPAHKVILGNKSAYFERLFDENADNKELEILHTSAAAFRFLLKYIYSGTIFIPTDAAVMLHLLILAHLHAFGQLTSSVIRKIESILDTKTIAFFVNGANEHDLEDLRNACHSFIDSNATQILTSDSFNDLTEKSVLGILKRENFWAPEIEIFKGVAKWCEKNSNNIVLRCVFLSSLTVPEITSIVWPSKLVSPDKLLEIVSQIVGTAPKENFPRGVLAVDQNVASVQYSANVISHADSAGLLNRNRNAEKHVTHIINGHGESGIVIQLNRPYLINHVRMKLYDVDSRSYSYYIETSVDQRKWHRVVDYSRYACRSVQNLYFDQRVCRYIRVVGTGSTKGSAFHLVFFEAFYKSKIPRINNGIVCPETNVATPENEAVVLEGVDSQYLLNGNHTTYCWHSLDSNGIVVQLPQPYDISSMQFLLPADWKYKYFVQTSVNNADWETVIDRRNEDCARWQDLQFPEKTVVFIKITGTYNSNYSGDFQCYHFECPSEGKK